MPEKTKRQTRLDNGYCGQCGVNKIYESPTCDQCKAKLRARHKQRIVERRKAGICTTCGLNPPVLNKKTCQKCLEKRAVYRASRDDTYENNRRFSRHELKRETMNRYGTVCVCCGESDIRFLTIDHINNDGADHRKAISVSGGDNFYRWLRKNGFPDGFQVLCYNCNIGRHQNGGICPHKDEQDGV